MAAPCAQPAALPRSRREWQEQGRTWCTRPAPEHHVVRQPLAAHKHGHGRQRVARQRQRLPILAHLHRPAAARARAQDSCTQQPSPRHPSVPPHPAQRPPGAHSAHWCVLQPRPAPLPPHASHACACLPPASPSARPSCRAAPCRLHCRGLRSQGTARSSSPPRPAAHPDTCPPCARPGWWRRGRLRGQGAGGSLSGPPCTLANSAPSLVRPTTRRLPRPPASPPCPACSRTPHTATRTPPTPTAPRATHLCAPPCPGWRS